MNPLRNNAPQDPISMLTQFLDGGGNPQQLLQQMLQRNPQAQQTIEQLKNVSGGAHPRDIMLQLAKQRGIDPNRIMQLTQRLGLK